jgi:hypothetical protein
MSTLPMNSVQDVHGAQAAVMQIQQSVAALICFGVPGDTIKALLQLLIDTLDEPAP